MNSFGKTRCILPQKPKTKKKNEESKEVQRDGPAVRNHISSKMAGRSIATQRTTYLSLSLVYRQALQLHLHLTSLTSSSKESVTPTEHPASTRSDSMSLEVRGNSSHGPAETENPNKNDDNELVRGNLSHDLPERLQEFRHGLVDESVPEHRDASSSSHELPSEQRAKVVSGKHRNLLTSRRTEIARSARGPKITVASCRRRTGTVVPRMDIFW